MTRRPWLVAAAATLLLFGAVAPAAASAAVADASGTLGAPDDPLVGDGESDPTNDTTDGVEETADSTTGEVGDTADSTTGEVGDTTDSTTDGVEETTDSTTSEVEETTDSTTDGTDQTDGGDATDSVGSTTGNATGTLTNGTEPLTNATKTVANTTKTVANATKTVANATTTLAAGTAIEGALATTLGTVEAVGTATLATTDPLVGATDRGDGAAGTTSDAVAGGTDGDLAPAGSTGDDRRGPAPTAAVADRGTAPTFPDDTGPVAPGTPGTPIGGVGAGLSVLALSAALSVAAGPSVLGAGGRPTARTLATAASGARTWLTAKAYDFVAVFRYSRWDDSDPLEHEARERLYAAVEATPGVHLSAVAERADLPLSTARHHLRVLADEDLLAVEKIRGKRRYFPAEADDVALAAALSTEATAAVLDALARLGSARNATIADELDRDPSTVAHHLENLEADDLVERERDGRAIRNRLAPHAARALGDAPPGEDAVATPPADD